MSHDPSKIQNLPALDLDDLISVKEASERLRLHENTVRKMIHEEKIPAYVLGRRSIRVSISDLRQLFTPYEPGTLGMWRHLL